MWETQKHRFDPWVRKVLWRRKWLPTPLFMPGKSHGQRSLVGYSLWGHKELRTHTHKTSCSLRTLELTVLPFPQKHHIIKK